MHHTYKTTGICARNIEFDIDEQNRIHNVRFMGGCSGNGQGLARTLEGMNVDEVISRLQGIRCQNGTSCPDQLAKALVEMKKN